MNDNRMIRIMVFEPGRAPYTTMLEDSLEHRQELVGGDIECIPLPCETVLCCNASGKLTGLPENRQYGPDILHGTFFLYCDTPEGRGVSLTDEQIAMYQEYFPQPVPAAVSFEVRSAADMKEFMNLMFGKGWDMAAQPLLALCAEELADLVARVFDTWTPEPERIWRQADEQNVFGGDSGCLPLSDDGAFCPR